jgi:hypothetical protein
MTAVITPLMLAYITAMYCLRRGEHGRVVDALAANWLINQVIVMGNAGFPDLPLFIAVDFFTGLWLATSNRGRVARRAALVFIPMIALNAAAYVNGDPVPWWHHGLLFALAWIQLGIVGAMNDGFRKALDSAVRSVRHPISSSMYFFRGRK